MQVNVFAIQGKLDEGTTHLMITVVLNSNQLNMNCYNAAGKLGYGILCVGIVLLEKQNFSGFFRMILDGHGGYHHVKL